MDDKQRNMVRVPCHPTMLQQILGGVMVLAAHSDLHRHYNIQTMFTRVGASLMSHQFFYAEKTNTQEKTSAPIQFMNWIMVNEEYMQKFRAGSWEYQGEIIPEGPYVLVLDVISPFIPSSAMVRRALHEVFARKMVKGVIFSRIRGDNSARIAYYDIKPRPFKSSKIDPKVPQEAIETTQKNGTSADTASVKPEKKASTKTLSEKKPSATRSGKAKKSS